MLDQRLGNLERHHWAPIGPAICILETVAVHMQSSMLITHNDCTYSWAALLESPAAFPRAVGEAARWAMDGAADRTQPLSVWMPAMKQRCTIEAVTVKAWGSDVGFVISLSNSLSLSVWQSGIYSRQTEKGSSVLMKAYLPDTEYTLPTHREETCYWLTKDLHMYI